MRRAALWRRAWALMLWLLVALALCAVPLLVTAL